MIRFIFFGRTTQEKGINLILDTFSRLNKEGISDWKLDIFGDGPLAEKCKQASENRENIQYHGWATMETICSYLQDTDYSLAPSHILETFGKSALTSLEYGVPVIGFSKGGLAQFIQTDLIIDENNPSESFYTICKNIIQNSLHPNKNEVKKNATPYQKQERIKSIQTVFGEQISEKKTPLSILHISDFISKIGGIELYLRESKELLENNGYTVDLFGSEKKISFGGMIKSACNIPAWYKLQHLLKKNTSKKKYDILRFHSLLRNLGPVILCGLQKNTTKIFMVHDLGYFHPYPSKLYSESDIPTFSLKGFLSKHTLTHGSSLKNKILITLKFLSLKILKKRLIKNIDIRVVPSPFLIEILHTSRGIPKEKIYILPHFS